MRTNILICVAQKKDSVNFFILYFVSEKVKMREGGGYELKCEKKKRRKEKGKKKQYIRYVE